MRVFALDTETALFRPGLKAPPLACVSWCEGSDVDVTHWTDSERHLLACLENEDILIVGHNVAYDMAVICAQFPRLTPAVFAAYDANRVTDTMIRQKLIDIADGRYRGYRTDKGAWQAYEYSLEALSKRHRGPVLEKSEWRLKFGYWREKPLPDWPTGAVQYAKEDARATYHVYSAQPEDKILTQYEEARSAFWLQLMSCWGLKVDPSKVRTLEDAMRADIAASAETLQKADLVRANGSRNTKNAIAIAEKIPGHRKTKGGKKGQPKPALDADACKESGNESLIEYSRYSTLSKGISTDIPMLKDGTYMPIHSSFDLADSARTTSKGPNVQNLSTRPGVREAFVPRPGNVFIDADYNALELWSLAQVQLELFGESALADVLNSGKDPHTALAGRMLGIEYDEAARRKRDPEDKEFDGARRMSKVANFGFPGGMAKADKFVLYARKFGLTVTEAEAKKLRDKWLLEWPQMRKYFDHVNRQIRYTDDTSTVKMPISGFVRGGKGYTETCNGYFQHLGAMAAKRAGWLIAKACYIDRASPLFGSRIVCFVHDQFIVETPEGPKMGDAAKEVARLMQEGAKHYMPKCVPGVEPHLSRYWSKKACPVYNADGSLGVWPDGPR